MQLSISLKSGPFPNFLVLMTLWVELFFLLRIFFHPQKFSLLLMQNYHWYWLHTDVGTYWGSKCLQDHPRSMPFLPILTVSLFNPHLVMSSHNTPQSLTCTRLILLLQINISKEGRISSQGKLFWCPITIAEKKSISFLWASSLKSCSHDWNSKSQSIHLLINKFLDKYGIRCSMFSRLQNFLISSFWCGQRIGQVIIYCQNDKKAQLEAAIWHYESFHQKKTVEKVFLSWIDFGLCLTELSHLISKKNNSVMVMLYKFTDEILVLCLLSDYLKLGVENICNSLLMLKKQTNIFQIMGGWWLAGETRLHKALKRWGAWSAVPTLHWHFCMEIFWLYDKTEKMDGFAAQFFKNSLNFFRVYFIRLFFCLNCPLQKTCPFTTVTEEILDLQLCGLVLNQHSWLTPVKWSA